MVALGDQPSIVPPAITERFSTVGSDAKSGCPSVMINVAAGPSKWVERAASLSNACARTNLVGSSSERPTNQPTVVVSSRMCGSALAKTAISSSADSGRAAKRRMWAACVIVELLPVAYGSGDAPDCRLLFYEASALRLAVDGSLAARWPDAAR